MRARAGVIALLVLAGCDDGPPPPAAERPPPQPVDTVVLHLAGSGAATPIASRLAQAWAREQRTPRIFVEPSIGSGGGIRAAADGVVDVGLSARPLTDAERALGLTATRFARDAVVLAAHPSVPVDEVSTPQLVEWMDGRTTRYPDGTPVTLLLRDRDDSAHAALERMAPGLRGPREAAWAARRFRILLHDDAMGEALASTPGAIGPFSLGAVTVSNLPVKVLPLDGVRPSPERIESGQWQATRDLSFVSRSDRVERARPFMDFVASPRGVELIRSSGYVPLSP